MRVITNSKGLDEHGFQRCNNCGLQYIEGYSDKPEQCQECSDEEEAKPQYIDEEALYFSGIQE